MISHALKYYSPGEDDGGGVLLIPAKVVGLLVGGGGGPLILPGCGNDPACGPLVKLEDTGCGRPPGPTGRCPNKGGPCGCDIGGPGGEGPLNGPFATGGPGGRTPVCEGIPLGG